MSVETATEPSPDGPPRGGGLLKVVNPANGETLREVAEDGPEEIARRVERARKAQVGWAKTPLAERKAALAGFGGAIAQRKEELATLLTSEMGKPIAQSRNELIALQSRLKFFLGQVEAALADEVVHDERGWRERISYEPLGLVANVSAWNYPYFVGSNVFVPALLAGNAVLY
ncbi:MAG TPA: aldehyde dehydrogenase family protein, partial [Vicinamibacteria bacterium]|nr:aldehyde dehydrogenase family protein [Vicinamibacteria bacterium]